MSQVIYSRPGWSSPFLGRGNSVCPPALSGVIMFSVKHNQSPRSSPLYKPQRPPINTGWLGDLSSRADCRAEPSWAERSSRQWAESWCRREVRPVGDLPTGQWPICYGPTWGKMGEKSLFAGACDEIYRCIKVIFLCIRTQKLILDKVWLLAKSLKQRTLTYMNEIKQIL